MFKLIKTLTLPLGDRQDMGWSMWEGVWHVKLERIVVVRFDVVACSGCCVHQFASHLPFRGSGLENVTLTVFWRLDG